MGSTKVLVQNPKSSLPPSCLLLTTAVSPIVTKMPTVDGIVAAKSPAEMSNGQIEENAASNISLESITDGKNERGIPATKFLDDIESFANSFDPPASPELLIGAYSDLYSKFKAYEKQLRQKRATYHENLTEIEKSITLVRHLKKKKEEGDSVITRYNLADTIYAKAEVDCSQGIVNLWLGANVMLEYTYDEALDLWISKETLAKKDYQEVGLAPLDTCLPITLCYKGLISKSRNLLLSCLH